MGPLLCGSSINATTADSVCILSSSVRQLITTSDAKEHSTPAKEGLRENYGIRPMSVVFIFFEALEVH